MNTLEDVAEHISHLDKGSGCAVGKWYGRLSAEDQAQFDRITAAKNVHAQYRYRKIEPFVPFSLTTFKAHLRNECPCH